MGDMYDIVHGDGKQRVRFGHYAEVLLNIMLEDVGRFRDCWVEDVDGRLIVAIYTRNGGGNRPDYEAVSKHLATHPGYIEDADDEFDSTYRTYRFAVPTEFPPHLAGLKDWEENWPKVQELVRQVAHPGRVNMDERWKEALAKVENGEMTPKMVAAADQLGAALKEALDNPGDGPKIIRL